MVVDMSVRLGGLELKNPVLTASGTFGYGLEYGRLVDLARLGGIVVKGLSLEPWAGNPPPRLWETASGMLNSIGLENIGLAAFVRDKLPLLKDCGTAVVANIWGDYIEDYARLAEALTQAGGLAAVELNISCPNKGGKVMCLGQDPDETYKVVKLVKETSDLPVWVKLTPNVADIGSIARAAQAAGADALSLINTLLGMAIDPATRRPRLGNVVGGLSGPAIKPVALRLVWQAASVIDIPVIGLGGIMTGPDAAEFLIAGASAVQVGTASFTDPGAALKIIDGLEEFCREQKVEAVGELVGSLRID